MKTGIFATAFACMVATGTVVASGYRSPAHSQLSYSFTCPGNASGHATYQRKGYPAKGGILTLWVNGQDLHGHSGIAPLMHTHNLQAISASCEDGRAVVFLELWDLAAQKVVRLTVHVNEQGQAQVAGP